MFFFSSVAKQKQNIYEMQKVSYLAINYKNYQMKISSITLKQRVVYFVFFMLDCVLDVYCNQ